MELGFKAQGPVLLRKAFQAEGRAEAKAGRFSSAGSFREWIPGREERPGCSAQAMFPFPRSLRSFHPSLVYL